MAFDSKDLEEKTNRSDIFHQYRQIVSDIARAMDNTFGDKEINLLADFISDRVSPSSLDNAIGYLLDSNVDNSNFQLLISAFKSDLFTIDQKSSLCNYSLDYLKMGFDYKSAKSRIGDLLFKLDGNENTCGDRECLKDAQNRYDEAISEGKQDQDLIYLKRKVEYWRKEVDSKEKELNENQEIISKIDKICELANVVNQYRIQEKCRELNEVLLKYEAIPQSGMHVNLIKDKVNLSFQEEKTSSQNHQERSNDIIYDVGQTEMPRKSAYEPNIEEDADLSDVENMRKPSPSATISPADDVYNVKFTEVVSTQDSSERLEEEDIASKIEFDDSKLKKVHKLYNDNLFKSCELETFIKTINLSAESSPIIIKDGNKERVLFLVYVLSHEIKDKIVRNDWVDRVLESFVDVNSNHIDRNIYERSKCKCLDPRGSKNNKELVSNLKLIFSFQILVKSGRGGNMPTISWPQNGLS